MATTGSFSTNTGVNFNLIAYWSHEQDIANNTSSVTVTLKARHYSISCNALSGSYLSIGGDNTPFAKAIYQSADVLTETTLLTKTVIVPHDSSTGQGSCRIQAAYVFNGTYGGKYIGTLTIDETLTLPTIPRASTITSVSNVTLGNNCSVTWTPLNSSYRYEVYFWTGSWSSPDWRGWSYESELDYIYPNRTTSYTYTRYTFPLDAIAKLYPNNSSITIGVELRTYTASSDIAIGYDSKLFTATVPNNSDTQPTVTMTLSPVSSLGSAFSGLYIQGKTKVQATLSATAKYNATIKSYSMNVDSTSYGSDKSYTSDYLLKAGSTTVYGYATDSRGFTGTTEQTINVIGYSKPKITVSECYRCKSDGTPDDSGTSLLIKATRSYSTITVDGLQKNFCEIRCRYKVASESSFSGWKTILDKSDTSTNEFSGVVSNVQLDVNKSYHVEIQVFDDIGESNPTTIIVPTEVVHDHKTATGWGLGKYCEGENLLDVGWDANFDKDLTVKGKILNNRLYSLIATEVIPQEADLNNYKTIGTYTVASNEDAGTISNMPCASAGILIVYCALGINIDYEAEYTYLTQEYKSYDLNTYARCVYTNGTPNDWTFGDWKLISSPQNI